VHGPLMVGPYRLPDWVPPSGRRWLWRWAGRTIIDPVALPEVNAARAACGLAPFATLLPDMLAVPDLSITLFPEWFAPNQPDWPQPIVRAGFPLYDPHPGAALSPELERFLADGPAPLVFTHGTANAQAAGFFRHARVAVGGLGADGKPVRAVFLSAHREQIGPDLPASILWQEYVPLRRLLPRAALLVHHGGIGTTAEALQAGVPQLVVPLAHDQFDNGARVAALGVGASLAAAKLGDPVRAAKLTRALGGLLGDPQVAARCAALRRRVASSPGMDTLCARLEGLPDAA
jgi:rhamnosyltransferase subunit B